MAAYLAFILYFVLCKTRQLYEQSCVELEKRNLQKCDLIHKSLIKKGTLAQAAYLLETSKKMRKMRIEKGEGIKKEQFMKY